jgi:radical SAM superfamily enzyme YgiQ (UPF0313 family)
MRIAFLYPEMETLGIQYLSSVLKQKGHQTKLFFDPQLFMDTVMINPKLANIFDCSDKIIHGIEEYQPQLVAFSVLSTNYRWACKLARKIKMNFNIPIVFGGIHPTSVPAAVLQNEFVDFIIMGEGEYALLELAESEFNKQLFPMIKNLCYKNQGEFCYNPLREPVHDLDALPFPDKELFYENLPYLQRRYTIITSRGCPHRCTYCCNDFLNKLYNKKFLRRRSTENVIAELRWAMTKYEIHSILFDDSTFTYDKKWLRDFAEKYRDQIGLVCFCWVYPTDVDEELMEIFNTMNCRAVEMGVESFNADVRKNLFHRFYENRDIEMALALFRKNKIFCTVDNIKGFSPDLEEEMLELALFYNQHRANKIYIFEYRAFPQTELANKLQHKQESSISGILPFTIATSATKRRVRQLELVLAFTYFLPRFLVKLVIKKRLYRFFPPLPSYNLLEIVPYFINLFRITKNSSLFYVMRGTRKRYVHSFLSDFPYFLKRIMGLWA